ncbi:Uncharacterized protein PBTT_03992 [Plasmodiophora brassicae]
MRRLRSVIAVGLLAVVCGAAQCNADRPNEGPADNRTHVSDAIVRLEEARSSLSTAERIITDMARSFPGHTLRQIRRPSGTGESTRSPSVCPYANPPTFEAVFRTFERGLVTGLLSHLTSVDTLERLICCIFSTIDNHIQCGSPNRGATVRRNSTVVLVDRLASIMRTGTVRTRTVDSHRPPNIFAMRDANFVDLPVRRFWNVTQVPVEDLVNAITVTRGQIAATRSMVIQMNADRVVVMDLFYEALALSKRRLITSMTLLVNLLGQLTSTLSGENIPVVEKDIASVRASAHQFELLVDRVTHMKERYKAALKHLDNAVIYLHQSRYQTNLHLLLQTDTARAA